MGFGPTELFIIFAIVLLLFGAGKVPKLARSMGTAVTEFKQGIQGAKESLQQEEAQQEAKPEHGEQAETAAPAQHQERAEQS